jgi:hypothetical protein
LQLLLFNEEFLVVAIHQIATITSLPFVHTARRYYRSNGLVRPLDRPARLETTGPRREVGQTWSFRGSKSRNKVSVGEPAEGSFPKGPVLASRPQARGESLCFGAFVRQIDYARFFVLRRNQNKRKKKTFNKGSLGSHIDEERSEARKVV